jgi:hypothetical protein
MSSCPRRRTRADGRALPSSKRKLHDAYARRQFGSAVTVGLLPAVNQAGDLVAQRLLGAVEASATSNGRVVKKPKKRGRPRDASRYSRLVMMEG